MEGDTIKKDYERIVNDERIQKILLHYKEKEDCLPNLFQKIYELVKDTSDTFKDVTVMIFTMFHAQAEVERGFSTNKHCATDNLEEDSLVARRRVCEYVAKEYDSDASKVDITKKMLLDCRNASQA